MNDLFAMLNSLNSMLDPSEMPRNNYTPLEKDKIDTIMSIAKNFEKGNRLGGLYYYAEFENGYGIDIIKHNGSYGGDEDLFEIAVMKDGDVCYDTSITDDVVGWLTSEEVMSYVFKVKELKVE